MGKVYMVVGGAPETNETHVRDVALGNLILLNGFYHMLIRIDF